jgi:ElaB/YqjD/DUF883 family membrane-anchored ribosome-binding protein
MMLVWVSARLLIYVNFPGTGFPAQSWFGEAEPDGVLIPVSSWRTAMADAPSAQNQPSSGGATSQTKRCPPDCDLPENSQENLDARLDHAIEETFPTSDPISVTITKGPEPDRPDQEPHASSANDEQDRPEQDSNEHLLDQVREELNDVAGSASEAAGKVYSRGEHYVQQAGEHYPEAARYYQAGHQAVRQRMTESPWIFLLAAGAVGYVLAWMIHGQPRSRDRRVPDYARTRRSYAAHRDGQQEG